MISNTKFAVLAAAILSSLSSALFTPLSTSKDLASLSANFTNDADVEIFDRTTTKRSNRVSSHTSSLHERTKRTLGSHVLLAEVERSSPR